MAPLLTPLLVFLAPLALYLLFLAFLNRRNQPTLLTGVTDGAFMLLASSGFFLYAVPFVILQRFYHQELLSVPLDHPASAAAFDAIWLKWLLLWGLYYVVIVGVASLLLWWRYGVTVIYNVDVERFREVLAQCLDELQLDFQVEQGRILTFPRAPVLDQPSAPGCASFRIEYFPAMAHLTIVWHDAGQGTRRLLENALHRNLASATAWNNPCTMWLMGLSGLFSGITFFLLGLWITMTFFPRRHW